MSDITVLVVEDDPDHRELIVQALRECCDPARIATAQDGGDALDFLLGRGAHAGRDARRQPRLVVLDLQLTRVHGLEVLQALRADPATAGLPVVVLSGSSDKQVLDSCYAAGANSVVRKTTDFEELCRKMRGVHDFWTTVNESNRHSRV